MTTTREPRVGDRVRVTASREQLRSIHVPERLAGSCGWVEINDEDAEVDGHSVTWLVRFSSGDYEWWLARSDFTLLNEEPADVLCDECSGDGQTYVGYASDNAYMDCETCEHCRGTGRCSCELCRAEDELARAGSADKMKPREEPSSQPPTVGFDDLEVGRRYRFEGGGAEPFKVTGPKRRPDDAGPVWPVWFEGAGEGYIWDDNGRRFVHLDPEPEPAQSVRTKAETLDLMKALLPQTDRGARQVWLDVGEEARLTPEEVDLINAGYRALYEKLKESL